MSEQWATDPDADDAAALLYTDGDFIPNDRLPDVAGGCFGNGPSGFIALFLHDLKQNCQNQ